LLASVSGPNGPKSKRLPTRLYLDTHPLHDYEPLRKLGTSWHGTLRNGSSHSLFTVDRVHNASLLSIFQFSRLCHVNLVAPVAFYCVLDDLYVVHECQGESLSDLHPLPAQDATNILFQVCDTVPAPNWLSISLLVRSSIQSITWSGPAWRFA
jgi:hypothetical protein